MWSSLTVARLRPLGEYARSVIDDVYQALMGLGHTPVEARGRVDDLIGSGKPFRTVSDALTIIYGSGKG